MALLLISTYASDIVRIWLLFGPTENMIKEPPRNHGSLKLQVRTAHSLSEVRSELTAFNIRK